MNHVCLIILPRSGINRVMVMGEDQNQQPTGVGIEKYHVQNKVQGKQVVMPNVQKQLQDNRVEYQVQENQVDDEVMVSVRRHHQERREENIGTVRETLAFKGEHQRSTRFIPLWMHQDRSVKFQGQLVLSQMLSVRLEMEVVRDVHRIRRAVVQRGVRKIVIY